MYTGNIKPVKNKFKHSVYILEIFYLISHIQENEALNEYFIFKMIRYFA